MKKRIFSIDFLGALLVFAAIVYSGKVVDDTLWSIRLGGDFFHGHSMFTERYSWTARGDYYPNHEWLFEALIYVLYVLGGKTFILLYAFQGLLGTVGYWLLRPSKLLRKEWGSSKAAIFVGYALLVPLIIVSNPLFWEIRAQSMSFFFIALYLFLLRTERYRWLPLAMIPWANFHAGFIIGCYLIFTTTLIAIFWMAKERNKVNTDRVLKLFFYGALTLIATCASPLGWKIWFYFSDKAGDSMNFQILEFIPTLKVPFALPILYTLLAVFFVAVGFVFKKSIKSWEMSLIVFLPLLYLPIVFSALRFLFIFHIITVTIVFLVPMTIEKYGWVQKIVNRIKRVRIPLIRFHSVGSLIVIMAVILFSAHYSMVNKKKDMSFEPSSSFIKTLKTCDGNIYNDYRSGAGLVFWVRDVPVFVDNRYDPYPPELRKYFSLEKGKDWNNYLSGMNVSCIVIAKQNLTDEIKQSKWKKIYGTGKWLIFSNPDYDPTKPTVFKLPKE